MELCIRRYFEFRRIMQRPGGQIQIKRKCLLRISHKHRDKDKELHERRDNLGNLFESSLTLINTASGSFTVYDLVITPTLQNPLGAMPVIANGYLDMKCGPGGC